MHRALAILLVFSLFPLAVRAQDAAAELEAYWAESVRTIVEGDFAGYAATYHPDAVLVNLSEQTTYPIQQALDGWKYLFDNTAAGKATASLESRFSRTMHDATTAHQTGIFRYQYDPEEGEGYVSQVHFEALLVKKDGRWLCVMEFQKEPATDAEWEALQ